MIRLTRLNGTTLFLNGDLLQSVESTPDTILTLVTGEKLLVREPAQLVLRRFHARRRKLGRAAVVLLPRVGEEVEA